MDLILKSLRTKVEINHKR